MGAYVHPAKRCGDGERCRRDAPAGGELGERRRSECGGNRRVTRRKAAAFLMSASLVYVREEGGWSRPTARVLHSFGEEVRHHAGARDRNCGAPAKGRQ